MIFIKIFIMNTDLKIYSGAKVFLLYNSIVRNRLEIGYKNEL